jgi:hypothetical protein
MVRCNENRPAATFALGGDDGSDGGQRAQNGNLECIDDLRCLSRIQVGVADVYRTECIVDQHRWTTDGRHDFFECSLERQRVACIRRKVFGKDTRLRETFDELTERRGIASDESQPVRTRPPKTTSNRKTASRPDPDNDANRTRRRRYLRLLKDAPSDRRRLARKPLDVASILLLAALQARSARSKSVRRYVGT